MLAAHSLRAALDRIRNTRVVHGAIVAHPLRRHSGLDIVELLRARHSDVAVMVWTEAAIGALVNAFLPTPIDYCVKPPDAACIEHLLRRASAVAREAAVTASQPVRITMYTPRERQIQDCINAGCTDKEIAELLGSAVETVRTHKKRMRSKVGSKSLRDLERVLPRPLTA